MKQVNIQFPLRMLGLLLGLFLSVGAFAQIDVKGHVKDATGEPIIGATVRVASSQAATITDFDGNFVLKANQGDNITISYIGYQTATVKAAPSIEVTLDVDADTTMLGDLIDITLFGVVDGCLALAGPVNGAVAIVHSRKAKGGTMVSSQFFVVSNSYLAQFQSAAAFEAAVKSYGGLTRDEFLTPNVDSIVAPNV